MKVLLAKILSKASSYTIWIACFIVFALIVLVPLLPQSLLAKLLADFFSSTSLRNIAYEGMCRDNTGWSSAIAYAIGVIFVLGILVPVVTNRLRTIGERYLNGTMDKYPWRNHALFIGYDGLMIGTLKQASKDYNSIVVAVSGNVSQIREQLSRSLSDSMGTIEIVQCNQDDESHLVKKARIMKASRIFIIGQPDNPTHDAHNLRTLAIIAKKWNEKEISNKKKDPNYKVPHIMVYLRNQSTISLLQRQGFKAENLWNTINATLNEQEIHVAQAFVNCHCEYFNFYCDKALRLLTTKPKEEGEEWGGMSLIWHSKEKNISIPEMENRQVHLVVLGMTQMGTALVRELLKLAHPSGKGTKMLITMVDKNAREEMRYFVGHARELFKLCRYSYYDFDKPENDIPPKNLDDDFVDVEFEFIKCDVAHPRLTEKLLDWSKDDKQLLTLVICTNDSPQNMAVAMYLPPEMICGENAVPTWVYQEGDDSMQQLLDREKYTNMHTFSFADHVVASTANSPIYEWDKKVTNYYEEHYKTKDVAEKWENKSQSDRWSSLYSIQSIVIKLLAVGIQDVTPETEIDESQKRLIDYYEHNRWVVERLMMGSRPTNAEQHEEVVKELEKELKKHPDWKPKDNTPEEKDRSREVCKTIDDNRSTFKELKAGVKVKGVQIHDNIRSFEDLDDFSKYKDRRMLDDYIESIRKNPKP